MLNQSIPSLDAKGLRDFGFLMGGVIAVLFGLALPWLFAGTYRLWPWIVSGAFVATALIAPLALRPIYSGWMRFGLLASKVTTPIVLGIVFYLVIAPVGLLRRWIGGDPMPKRTDPQCSTYRVASKASDLRKLERPF